MQNVNVSNLVRLYQSDLEEAFKYADFLLKNKNTMIVNITANQDQQLSYDLSKNNDILILEALRKTLKERVISQSWKNYFNLIELYEIIGDEYFKIIEKYTLKNIVKNTRYDHDYINPLTPFSEDNIEDFKTKYLSLTDEEIKKSVEHFLISCGATVSTHPTKYRPKLMMRNVGGFNKIVGKDSTTQYLLQFEKSKIEELKSLGLAITNKIESLDLDKSIELRKQLNSCFVDKYGFSTENKIEVMEGFSVKVRPNANLDIFLSEKNVELLNEYL
jgi:hypothetical protein